MTTYYCRLCFVNSKPEESLLFSKYITDMIQFCIPEVDVKLVNNPILCTECYDRLEQMLKFKKKCLEVQDNINQMLSNNGAREGVDLNTHLINTNISSTISDPVEDTEIGECQSKSSVLRNNETVEHSPMLNISTLSDTCDQTMLSLSSVDIKPEVGVSTSTVCDSSDNLFLNSFPKCETRVGKSASRKRKIVKNILNVKFSHKYCYTCKLPFKNLTEIIQHLYSEHQNNEELYLCLLCRYKSNKLSSIKSHYSNCHNKCIDLNTSCIFCLTYKESFEELAKHMSEKHSSVCKSGKYFCNSCDFLSKSYMNFRKHYFLSHDLICNYCLRYCEDISSLNRHLGNHFSNSKRHSIVEFKRVI